MCSAKTFLATAALASAAIAGCLPYRWTSDAPADMRTVSVPEFLNETDVPELGAAVTRQTLREFQREGTFSIKREGGSALEVQGILKKVDRVPVSYDRNYGMRASEYRMSVAAEVSLIDKTAGVVLVDNRIYRAETTFMSGRDLLTGRNNAMDRLAADLARQIVDDVRNFDWTRPAAAEGGK